MRRTPLIIAAVLAVASLGGACSQQKDPTKNELSEDLADELQEVDSSLTAKQADCYADLLVEKVGVKRVIDVDFSDKQPADEIADRIATAAVAARDECGLQDAPR